MKGRVLTVVLLLLVSIIQANAQDIKIHSPHAESYACTEHWDGQFKWIGDALGTDCIVQGWYKDGTKMFLRPFKNQGFENKDWFGFQKNVLAPCDCTISAIHINAKTNQPGVMNPGRASSITFKTQDKKSILIAHVQNVQVSVGEQVKAGQAVAKVGNNGYSRNPHVHIAAWDDQGVPLQIQFDQKTVGMASRENKKKTEAGQVK